MTDYLTLGHLLLFSCSGVSDDFVTPWTAAGQASLSFTVSLSLLKLIPIELMIPFNHFILCCPFSSRSRLNRMWVLNNKWLSTVANWNDSNLELFGPYCNLRIMFLDLSSQTKQVLTVVPPFSSFSLKNSDLHVRSIDLQSLCYMGRDF